MLRRPNYSISLLLGRSFKPPEPINSKPDDLALTLRAKNTEQRKLSAMSTKDGELNQK